MSKTVKLRKGLDIRLVGVANKVKTDSKVPSHVSVKPTDFHGTTPKMMVKEGDLVKAGDIILEFNGVRINQMKELPAIVAKTKVGTTVEVKIWRNKKELTKNVLLGRLETSDDFKVSEKKSEPPKDIIIEDLKITVRKLTKEVVKDAIQVYAENNGYYLKFYAAHFDIKTLNVLKDRKVARSKLLDDLLEKGESIDIENYDLIDFNIDNL